MENNGLEIHLNAYYKNKPIRAWLANEVGRTAINSKRDETNPLKEHEVDLSLIENLHYTEAVKVVKKDLIATVGNAGIAIKNEDFPDVVIYKPDLEIIKQFGAFQHSTTNSAIGRVEISQGDKKWFLLLSQYEHLHHEIDHSVGRIVYVVHPSEKFRKLDVFQADTHINEERGGFVVKRTQSGLFLEEGCVGYLSREFVLDSREPVIVNARTELVRTVVGSGPPQRDLDIRSICKARLEAADLGRYKYSRLLIETLIESARRVSNEDAIEMKKDLVGARIDTKRTRSLMDRVDRLFGSGTFSKIWKMSFEEIDQEANKIYINVLRQAHGLDIIK